MPIQGILLTSSMADSGLYDMAEGNSGEDLTQMVAILGFYPLL